MRSLAVTTRSVDSSSVLPRTSRAFFGSAGPGPVNAIPAAAPTLGAGRLTGAELVTLQPGPLPGVVIVS